MISGIITATLCVAIVGLLIGVFLGIAGNKLKVEVDEREEAIIGILPGNNCGGCGYPGCSGLAAAIVKGEASVAGCPVGGKPVADKVAEVMGVAAQDVAEMVAFVKCQGSCDRAPVQYDYAGSKSCTMQKFVPAGGAKKCADGCLGGGDCVRVCDEGAIKIIDGIAHVDENICKGCGMCAKVCPKGVIEIVPKSSRVRVACSSKAKGPVAMKACQTACIGCMLCQKNCESGAITVENSLAHIGYDKCTECGVCVEKCPKKAIVQSE